MQIEFIAFALRNLQDSNLFVYLYSVNYINKCFLNKVAPPHLLGYWGGIYLLCWGTVVPFTHVL